MYDSIDINEELVLILGDQPIIETSDSIKEQDTVSNIAERHWGE